MCHHVPQTASAPTNPSPNKLYRSKSIPVRDSLYDDSPAPKMLSCRSRCSYKPAPPLDIVTAVLALIVGATDANADSLVTANIYCTAPVGSLSKSLCSTCNTTNFLFNTSSVLGGGTVERVPLCWGMYGAKFYDTGNPLRATRTPYDSMIAVYLSSPHGRDAGGNVTLDLFQTPTHERRGGGAGGEGGGWRG